MNTPIARSRLVVYAGWSAYASAAALLLTAVTLLLFLSTGSWWGTWYDAATAFQILFMLPVVLALYARFGNGFRALNLLTVAFGVLSVVTAAGFLVFLFAGGFGPGAQGLTPGAILPVSRPFGLWLVFTGFLGQATRTLPKTLTWFGMLAGAGYVIAASAFDLIGGLNVLFLLGCLAATIGIGIWALWLGRLLPASDPSAASE